MDHAEAVQSQAVERYLLGEFSAAQEDDFAEHFFDCDECASDMRLTSLFMDTSKKVLAANHQANPGPLAKAAGSTWHSARFAIAASIALLAFILYQNAVMIPKLRDSSAPQALDYFSMTNLGSRGTGPTVITPIRNKPFILLVDIPTHQDIDEYRCEVLRPGGSRVLSIDVSEALASKTVPLLIPASALAPGTYTFSLSGRSKSRPDYIQLEKHQFQVS